MVPLPCLLIHQLLMFNIICFDHIKLWCLYHGLGTIDFPSVRPEKCLLWIVCCCHALPKQCGRESLCMLSQIDDMEQTCRLSAAAPALSSRRATSPSSSASSTASSGPPTSGSSTRRPSGSQEVLRYCCKAHPLELCPNYCWFTLIFNPV